MEPLTKRILAIVLIAVVGVGIGLTIWIFVAPYQWSAKDCPGAPANISSDQIIRMGVLGGLYDIQGEGAYQGAWLAAYEINQAGGITVNGKTYYIGITAEDTDESNPNLDVSKGVAAAKRIIDYKQCQFLLGGFRSESLLAYQEIIMDAKIPFIDTGAATDLFCQNVLDNYDRYKYFFRVMPINSTSLGGEIITYLLTMATVLNTTKIGLIYEDLTWTAPMVAAFKYYFGLYNLSIVAEVAYPITVTQTEMNGYVTSINANKTQMLIPVISAQGGILLMNAYKTIKPGFVVIGIDVQSQLETFWADTNGACKYETTLQSLYNTSKTSKSVPFWNAYVAKWEREPLYTAVGSYDAVYLYAWAINQTQSFNADTIVSQLETVTTANPIEGAGGMLAFTKSHDVYEGHPYGYTLFVQWQEDPSNPGQPKKVVVPTYGAVYPDTIATGNYLTPGADGDPDWASWQFNK